jgi:predicted lipoprotein with Yx(FWY)xxD motif
MSFPTIHHYTTLRPALLSCVLGAALFAACVAQPPGLPSDEVAGAAGSSPSAQAGSDDVPAGGGLHASDGGDAQGGADGGDGNANPDPQAGNAAGGSTESGGTGGALGVAGQVGQGNGGTVGVKIAPTCPFHTDAVVASGGAGGSGGSGGSVAAGGTGAGAGGAGPAPSVTLQVSAFVGSYLADSAGRSLYTYGADLPGDCHTPPVSQCVTDCLVSWPLFPAGARVLPAGLDDSAFGAIQRGDGAWQTTYFGWPLYYYKSDVTLGQVSGQGKGKTWHLAQQKPPGVVILLKAGASKYLADRSGHTLYVSAADQVGSSDKAPASTCAGSCLDTFEPFHEQNFSVVTSLSAADFGAFVSSATGGLQVTYKGMPLYRAATDLKSGDVTGTASAGFTAALP